MRYFGESGKLSQSVVGTDGELTRSPESREDSGESPEGHSSPRSTGSQFRRLGTAQTLVVLFLACTPAFAADVAELGTSQGDRPSILAFNEAAPRRVAQFSIPRTFPGRFLYSERNPSVIPRTPRDPRSRYGTSVTYRIRRRSLSPDITRQ